jgi:3-hydroxyisobutyrate dehydrogenase-like beta-hydroxyacid dehydrogenase
MNAAVLGLGLIGSEWANHLAADGLLAAAWNRTPKPDAPFWTESIEAAVSKADIIHVVVADEQSALSVIKQCEPILEKRHIVIQSTTIDANTSSRLKAIVEERGARYLEAPFTGSLLAAKARQTVYYLGGSQELIDECKDYFSHTSEKQFIIGTNQQACRLKLNMNLLISAQIVALSEALSSSRVGGITDEVFFSALSANAASSGVSKLKEPKLREGDFSPQFSIKHMAKDMRLLGEMAETGPLHSICRAVLESASSMGFADEDISAVLKAFAPVGSR